MDSAFVAATVVVAIAATLMVALTEKVAVPDAVPVAFEIRKETELVQNPESLFNQKSDGPATYRKSTERSEDPFWIKVATTQFSNNRVLLIGDKQVRSLDIVTDDTRSSNPKKIDSYRRDETPSINFQRLPNTVAYHPTEAILESAYIYIRITALASSTISVTSAPTDTTASILAQTEREAGVLAGALCLLALFSATVAYISKSKLFRSFSFWLLSSLAACAVYAGYDTLWFGQWISSEHEVNAKLTIISTHALITTILFYELFRRSLARIRYSRSIIYLRTAAIALCVLAPFTPANAFLPAFWSYAGIAFFVSTIALSKILRVDPPATVYWYLAGWLVQITTSVAEVIYATGAIERIPGINGESGILIASLLTGVSVADTLRTERQRRMIAQKRAADAALLYRKIYDTVPVGMITALESGEISHANTEAEGRLLSGATRSLTGRLTIQHVIPQTTWDSLLIATLESGRAAAEVTLASSGNESSYFAVDAVRSGNNIELTFKDVSQQSNLAKRLTFLAEHDPLTGLANRRGLEQRFGDLKALVACGTPVCLAYFDLDRFKIVNEFYGHNVGDLILQEVARRMNEAAPTGTLTVRMGGDEFLMCLSGMNETDAHSTINSVLDLVTTPPYEIDGKALSISGSAGIVELSNDISFSDALAFADRACAVAKSKGRAMVADAKVSEEAIREYRARVQLGNTIRSRFPTESLRLFAQPIVRLTGADTRYRYEVLLRVIDKHGNFNAPKELLSIAEHQGLMAEVDRFVLRKTLEHLSESTLHTENLAFAAVNLSAMSLNDEKFIADATSILVEHKDVVRHLMLEITESVALSDISGTRRFVDQMTALGVGIALDDFGAGYTSFSYLKNFPADLVKIDGSFIRDLNRHPANYAITRAITTLCHELRIECLAEWVEDIPTLQGLIELDVDYAQGHVISREEPLGHWEHHTVNPVPLLQANDLLRRQSGISRSLLKVPQ